ncbi:hypothetical protein QBC35DRAFT_455919 [Podospora australis]|uniref:Uncharacterized protein n=1 Tax=Podospora australis TaxID=1536484 RepID=A0AAN6WP41_9PEZI|nr:hypothetical protein QBC35DRAFT_455919 [Podospora australis]
MLSQTVLLTTFALGGIPSVALAQTTTTVIKIFHLEPLEAGNLPSARASVISADASRTTYHIDCEGIPTACSMLHNATVVVGGATDGQANPTFMSVGSTETSIYTKTRTSSSSSNTDSTSTSTRRVRTTSSTSTKLPRSTEVARIYEGHWSCEINPQSTASCTGSTVFSESYTLLNSAGTGDGETTYGGEGGETAYLGQTSLAQAENYIPITVTAGLEKLQAAGTGGGGNGPAASVTRTSSSTGGAVAPMITGGAAAIFAGAVAFMGGVAVY